MPITAKLIGVQWVLMTLTFELIFGYTRGAFRKLQYLNYLIYFRLKSSPTE